MRSKECKIKRLATRKQKIAKLPKVPELKAGKGKPKIANRPEIPKKANKPKSHYFELDKVTRARIMKQYSCLSRWTKFCQR